jgi:hypothetical protein
MQIVNVGGVFLVIIVIWSIITLMTLVAGRKISSRLVVEESATLAADVSISGGIILLIGFSTSFTLWILFGTLIVPIPDISTVIVYYSGSSLVILASIGHIYYPIRKRIVAARSVDDSAK